MFTGRVDTSRVHNQVWGACWPSYEQQAMGMTCSVLCRCSREVIRRKSSLHDSFTAVNEHSTSGVNGPYPSLYSLLQGNLIRQGAATGDQSCDDDDDDEPLPVQEVHKQSLASRRFLEHKAKGRVM